MKRSTIIGAVGYVAAFLCGTVAGGALTFGTVTMPTIDLMRQSMLASSGHETYALYRYGSHKVARNALMSHLELTKGMTVENKGLQAFEIMLTYGRLAVTAEKAGQADEAQVFFRDAVAAPLADGGRVTEAQVRETVASMDQAWDQRLSGQAEVATKSGAAAGERGVVRLASLPHGQSRYR